MDYKDEISQIHWDTPLEDGEVKALAKKVLELPDDYSNIQDVPLFYAGKLFDGVLTNMGHENRLDFGIADAKKYITDHPTLKELRMTIGMDIEQAKISAQSMGFSIKINKEIFSVFIRLKKNCRLGEYRYEFAERKLVPKLIEPELITVKNK